MQKIIIHNVETNEIIEREMNAQESQQFELAAANWEAQLQAKQNAMTAKKLLLEKLGITEEEAKLLLA